MIQKYTVRCIGLLILTLLLTTAVTSCAEIPEEEETETVHMTEEIETEETETEKTEPAAEDMTADIDANLALLVSAFETISAAKPEGINEYDFIAANPDAFEKIVAWGEDAVPYLCEIGAEYRTAYANYRVDPQGYAKSILAYAAAHEIDPLTFDRANIAPDARHILYRKPAVLWGMGDSFEGILYDVTLTDVFGEVLCTAAGCSSYAFVDWTEDGRYAIVSDRLRDEQQLSQVTVFDTVRRQTVGFPKNELREQISAEVSAAFNSFDVLYQDMAENGLLLWLGAACKDGTELCGSCVFDPITQTITDIQYAPFDASSDNSDVARALECMEVGKSRRYLLADSIIYRLEVVVEEGFQRTLYINRNAALQEFQFLSDFRVIDRNTLAVVTCGTDINSEWLYIFDLQGNLLFETYYLTDKGMVFRGIRAVEEDRILLDGGRGYHGPTLVAPTKEEITAGDYADWLYNDPISDTVSGGELEQDEFGEVPLYRDRMADDLNFDLVMEGVYALPYLGNGKFGKIEHVETVQTLGDFLDALYGE